MQRQGAGLPVLHEFIANVVAVEGGGRTGVIVANHTMSLATLTSLTTWVPPSVHIGTNPISEELGLNPVASILVHELGLCRFLLEPDGFL